jgi:transposase-like protein
MKCPQCGSEQTRKNGHRRGKQNYLCRDCGRQFIEIYHHRGYSEEVKQICLKMYQYGIKPREIEQITGISHSTVNNWIGQAKLLPTDRKNHGILEKPDLE